MAAGNARPLAGEVADGKLAGGAKLFNTAERERKKIIPLEQDR